ncbi:hypothetical protein DPMN_143437 [Dreissena polymorpha]|uniref:Uncharacterized protein n=1 Tax=Dreissena polymorpha TaxID=45954 RepID=A0A9D4GH59_DREPO|nr:hypothetical protein DPMN_143437 [Dreissena polymorpha]
MTSRDEVKVGQSVQNLIAGVEDVLRLAAPARDQMIGLQSYMKQLVSVNAGIKKEAYQGLHTDNFPLSENDNPDAVFAEVERMVGFAKEELLRIQAAKNNKIRELEHERRELQENAKRTEEVQRRQIQELKENAKRTEEEQRRQIKKISDENDQLKNTAANQVAQNQKIH